MTAVAAIRLTGLTASATMPHAMDGELFVTYVEQGLVTGEQEGRAHGVDPAAGVRRPRTAAYRLWATRGHPAAVHGNRRGAKCTGPAAAHT